KMLQQILLLQEKKSRSFDASDALAVAVCHHFQQKIFNKTGVDKVSGWVDFINKNPGRVIVKP
ncbi:MAG TPA: hypothetical protein VM012_12510, partial [Flavitalea sp.]|nr:hypothetical protein [Flavitalea sp.]